MARRSNDTHDHKMSSPSSSPHRPRTASDYVSIVVGRSYSVFLRFAIRLPPFARPIPADPSDDDRFTNPALAVAVHAAVTSTADTITIQYHTPPTPFGPKHAPAIYAAMQRMMQNVLDVLVNTLSPSLAHTGFHILINDVLLC